MTIGCDTADIRTGKLNVTQALFLTNYQIYQLFCGFSVFAKPLIVTLGLKHVALSLCVTFHM
jgi:hypothetical protein